MMCVMKCACTISMQSYSLRQFEDHVGGGVVYMKLKFFLALQEREKWEFYWRSHEIIDLAVLV